MRHYFKTVLIVIVLLLFTFGCEKDDNLQFKETAAESKKIIRATIKSWTHLKEEKKILARRLAEINQLNALNRETTSSTYGFTISDTQVQVIEQDNFTTYTFFAFRDEINTSIIENYVFKEFSDGTFVQFY